MLFFYLKLIPVSVTQWTDTTQVTKGEQILSNTAITVASWATLFNESSDLKKKKSSRIWTVCRGTYEVVLLTLPNYTYGTEPSKKKKKKRELKLK